MLGAVGRLADLVAVLLEGRADPAQVVVVVDDQDARHRRPHSFFFPWKSSSRGPPAPSAVPSLGRQSPKPFWDSGDHPHAHPPLPPVPVTWPAGEAGEIILCVVPSGTSPPHVFCHAIICPGANRDLGSWYGERIHPTRRIKVTMPRTPFESYVREINETPLLSAGYEAELAWRIVEDGDAEARDHLVRANLRLVVNLARRYAGKGLALEDLIAEGNLGLLRAVEGFDPSLGVRFSTYACYWIKQSMKRAIVSTGRTVRMPRTPPSCWPSGAALPPSCARAGPRAGRGGGGRQPRPDRQEAEDRPRSRPHLGRMRGAGRNGRATGPTRASAARTRRGWLSGSSAG